MRRPAIVSLLLVALPFLASCGRVDHSAGRDLGEPPLAIVATTGMIADAVQNVGGRRVEVEALMGPGVDPHLYRASEGDVERLASADLIFFNGLHLEAKMAEVLERIEGRIVTAAVADGIPRTRLISSPQFSGAYDPHLWFDVSLWIEAGREVRDTLVGLDPTHAAVYRENAARYLAELAELDAEVEGLTALVSRDQRVLVTAHDAFGYFGRAYGFDVRGLQGISTATEAGAADVQELAEFIADRRIRAIFVESSVSEQTIRAVQEAVRSRGWDVEIGGRLFSDAMGDPGTAEGTYPGMVRSNVKTIVEALRGER